MTRSEPSTGPIDRSDESVNRGDESVYQLRYQRVQIPSADAPPVEILSTSAEPTAIPASPQAVRNDRRRTDPITHSLGMLATMMVLLLIARYFVPAIVEEVRYAWYRGELRAEYENGTEGLRNVSLESLSDAYEMVTASVGPSVVHIDVKRRATMSETELQQLLSTRFALPSDQGSGVIVDQDGYILTNRHVIADGEDITVTLSDGRRVTALLVGSDKLTDLAVLKIVASDLIPITWGNSDRARVGSPVWAVGSPFGLDRTVTFGILSGKHRKVRASTEWQDFMQSDVAVNPGNSGGPLVDARGTLIGINTAIVGETYQGVSFSVPSSVALKVFERLKNNGRVERGWLGVSLANLNDNELVDGDARIRGSKIYRMPDPNAPAALAGLLEGDVVRSVDGTAIRDTHHLMQVIAGGYPGETVQMNLWRDGRELDLEVQLGMRPDLD